MIIESDYGSVIEIQSSHTTQSETMRQAKTMLSMTNIVKVMDGNGILKTRVFHALGSEKKHASNYDLVEAEIVKQLKQQDPDFNLEHIIRVTDNCTAEYKSRKIIYNLRVSKLKFLKRFLEILFISSISSHTMFSTFSRNANFSISQLKI